MENQKIKIKQSIGYVLDFDFFGLDFRLIIGNRDSLILG